jgi:ABC-type transport system involved in multi-copper enzyme maturation permease subunit
MTALVGRLRPPRRAALGEFVASVGTMMAKELRSRFRGRRAFVVLTIYLAVLALIAYGAYSVVAPGARSQAAFGEFGAGNPNASAQVGQAIFSMLSVIQLLLVAFIAPALTAGAISLEREKQTLDLLIATPLRPGAIVIGKLLSALAFVALMILAGIPVSALVLMYGGASLDDILRQQVVLFATAIGLGVIGLFISALIKRTQAAIVLTYCTLLALTIGTLLIWRFWTGLLTNAPDNLTGGVRTAPDELLYVNPAVAMVEVVANTEITFGDFSEIMSYLLSGTGTVCDGGQCFPVNQGGSGVVSSDVAKELAIAADKLNELGPRPFGAIATANAQVVSSHFWPRFTATFAAISVLLTLASMRLVVPAGMRFGPRWRRSFTRRPSGPAAGEPVEAASVAEEGGP